MPKTGLDGMRVRIAAIWRVTTYAMLTRQPWPADVFILSLKAGGIWWNPAVENQATDRARFASASTATCSSTSS